jgi:hypothetical protein
MHPIVVDLIHRFADRSLLPHEVEVGEQRVRIGIWSKSPHGLEPPQLMNLGSPPAQKRLDFPIGDERPIGSCRGNDLGCNLLQLRDVDSSRIF